MSPDANEQPTLGWNPMPSQPGTWAWWDGAKWTASVFRAGDRWEYVYEDGTYREVPVRQPRSRRPPSRTRIALAFVLAAVLSAAMVIFGFAAYNAMNRNCERETSDVSACVSDRSMGVDFIDVLLFGGPVACVVLGTVGVVRRRRAARDEPEKLQPGSTPEVWPPAPRTRRRRRRSSDVAASS
jgi:hypothetical protein